MKDILIRGLQVIIFMTLSVDRTSNLIVVAYNPMQAFDTRIESICSELSRAHVIGLSGTGRKRLSHVSCYQTKRFGRYSAFDWGWIPKTAGINKCCGVMLLVDRTQFTNDPLSSSDKMFP